MNKFKLVPVLLLGWLLWASGLKGQVYPEFGMDFPFNFSDAMLGGSGGVMLPEPNLSFKASFLGRLGTRKVLVESEIPDTYFQYRERRYLFGIEAEKRLAIFYPGEEGDQIGAYGSAWGGFSIGDYRGTSSASPGGLAWHAGAGAYYWGGEVILLRAGYSYFPVKTLNIPPHRISLAIHLVIAQ